MFLTNTKLLACVLGTVCAVTLAPASAQNQRTTFDNFNGSPLLDLDRWNPTSPGWGVGIQEVRRVIRRGALNTRLRSTSLVDSPDAGDEFYRRNRLILEPSLIEGMTGLEATVKANTSYVRGCPLEGSTDNRITTSFARAALQSVAFNDGSSTTEGDLTGEYFVEIALEKRDDRPSARNQVSIGATLSRCDNADCSAFTHQVDHDMGRAFHGDQVRLSYVWDLTRQVIRWRAYNQTRDVDRRHVHNFSVDAPTTLPPANPRFTASVQARTKLPRCAPDSGRVSRPHGLIDADFDNVRVYRPR